MQLLFRSLLLFCWSYALCHGKKQKRWPVVWDIFGPFPAQRTDWRDPVDAMGGFLSLYPNETDTKEARWVEGRPDQEGVVLYEGKGEFQAWATANITVLLKQCIKATVYGAVTQAFLNQRLLPVSWEYPVIMPKGEATVRLRLRSTGVAKFVFRIDPCKKDIVPLDTLQDAPLPDVVGEDVGLVLHTRIHNLGHRWLQGAELSLPDELNAYVEVKESPMPVNVAPGQARVLHVEVQMRTDLEELPCPVPVTLVLEAESLQDQPPLEINQELRCRAFSEHFLFTYLDDDGSPQVAGVRAPTEPCEADTGCPVLLTMHGMDVDADRQSYAYRSKKGMWILAPHGRSKFAGFNWQNQGHRSAWAALRGLESFSKEFRGGSHPADVSRVIFTGHSNGAFGAMLLASEHPDIAMGVAPLAGMLAVHRPPRPLDHGKGGWKQFYFRTAGLNGILDMSLAPYNLEPLVTNIVGIPCLARTGADDTVIPPKLTAELARAVRRAGGQCKAVEVPDKGHWWWDSKTSMDGGVVDDNEMLAFWNRSLQLQEQQPQSSTTLPLSFRLRCVSLGICGGRGGIQVLQQHQPFVLSEVSVSRGEDSSSAWRLNTTNVDALGWKSVATSAGGGGPHIQDALARGGLIVDSIALTSSDLEGRTHICREGTKVWRPCPSAAECCTSSKRSPMQSGPLRAVFERRVVLVPGVGTGRRKGAKAPMDAAVVLANDRLSAFGSDMAIISSNESLWEEEGIMDMDTDLADSNFVLMGSPEDNPVTARLLEEGHLPDLQISEGHIKLGPCTFHGKDLALMALAPRFTHSSAVALLMTPSSAAPLQRLLSILSTQTEANWWQVRAPDFILLGSPSPDNPEVGTILAAGFWGGTSGWEFDGSVSYLHEQCLTAQPSYSSSSSPSAEL